MPRMPLYLLVFSAMIFMGAFEVLAAKKVALVIGNSAYEHTRVLANPKNDAAAIAGALKRIGFHSVTLKTDLNVDGMRMALKDFEDQADGADVAVIFFAGHGMELGNVNYLIPTDANLARDRHLKYEAIKLSSVLEAVDGASQLRLVILDACRNNPFAARMKLSSGASRSVARGLARIEPSNDMLVAYAARHGTTAADGAGRHSPYTEALLAHMAEPGVDIRLMLGKVRDRVREATNGEQVPYIYGTLGGSRVSLVPPRQGGQPDRFARLQEEVRELRAKLKNQKSGDNTKDSKLAPAKRPQPNTKADDHVLPKKAGPERTAKLFDLFCFNQLPDIGAIAKIAKAGGFTALKGAALQKYQSDVPAKDLKAWKFKDLGGEYVLITAKTKPKAAEIKDIPAFQGSTSYACTLFTPSNDPSSGVQQEMVKIMERKADATYDQGPLKVHSWTGQTDTLLVNIFHYASAKGQKTVLLSGVTFVKE